MPADIRENASADLPTDLSQAPAGLIRQELELILADMVQRGRQVGVGAGLLGGAGVLGVSAFAALTSALIAALERRPARGAFLMAAIYGAGAGTLTEAGVKRLRQSVDPQGAEATGRGAKATISGAPKTAGKAVTGAKSSANAVKRKSPAKAATARTSPTKATKGKPRTKAARST
jgi:Putative Actinobacterial Holin-X, holin superfamily III